MSEQPDVGRVAVVTGGGRGIGAATARHLADSGYSIVVNDVGTSVDGAMTDDTPAMAVCREIVARGGRAIPNADDVTLHATGRALIDLAVEEFGRLDVVVNAAGILRSRMVFNLSEEDWDAVMAVHLKGHFNLTKFAAAYWRASREPSAHRRLINFTSTSGLYGEPTQPSYAAAKMGIIGFTLSCARALAQYGVTANAIAPIAATRMTSDFPPGRRERMADQEITPGNVAPVVGYVASEEAAWCNGQVVMCQGKHVSLLSTSHPLGDVTAEPWTSSAIGARMLDEFGQLANPLGHDPC